MASKSDVKSIMARFQASEANAAESSSTLPGRSKQTLQPTLSSGPTIPTKKPVLESLSGSAITVPPKSTYLKSTISTKSDTELHEPNKTKALASRFANMNSDSNVSNKPFVVNKAKPPLSQAPEPKGPGQKPSTFHKPPLSTTFSDSKPAFPKPPALVSSKPSWVKEDSGSAPPPTPSATPLKVPPVQHKPSSSVLKLLQQSEEMANTDTANKSPPQANLKSVPNFRAAQNVFNKDKSEQSEGGVKVDGGSKPPLTAALSMPPPRPPASKKPSLKKQSNHSVNGDTTSVPKRKPLPNPFALGPAPTKPNRPPRVNLENFRKENGPGTFKKPVPLPSPASHPINHSNSTTPTQPPQAAVPSLPPRHPGTIIQPDECYDDIEELSSGPPPLPPSSGHPSQRAKEATDNNGDDDDDDGEMYEDLDERWEEQKQDKRNQKEDKRRQEVERKEQKEREKREQEARKKFKLVGTLEVIHQGKASADCRGSKTDLGLKQGDCVDIIRVHGNPEGKWLGRMQDGSIGYVKTTSVEIDFNSLKRHQTQEAYDPEVYDDIDVVSSDSSGIRGAGVVLPPPPGEDGEIYDDVDPNLDISPGDSRSSSSKPRGFLWMFDRSKRPSSSKDVPPPSQFTAQGNSDQLGAAIDEEIYDDVDAQSLPPLPPISSLPTLKGKNKSEEMDPKKQKKFEKEEKDFRKKFKYEGDVQVLDQVTIVATLTNKKWNGKDLPIKAGEKLDVIMKAVDNKLICRNEDGKFGYVSTCYIVTDDGEIYDDIGDDSIYDND